MAVVYWNGVRGGQFDLHMQSHEVMKFLDKTVVNISRTLQVISEDN